MTVWTMELFDPTSPNLDGDFKALISEQKNKEKKKKKFSLSTLAEDKEEDLGSPVSGSQLDAGLEGSSLHNLRKELLDAVNSDDVTACIAVCHKIEEEGLFLNNSVLVDPETSANALHIALTDKKLNAAEYLIKSTPTEILTDHFTVTISEVHSTKTCLHILSEQGNLNLAKLLLKNIPDGVLKDKYLRKTVLMTMEGQRPRHLSSIHIAALYGHTDLVDLFLDLGVDVNHTNNKNDTPVLWAARYNHMETVRQLIKRGADLSMENDKGSTPLYWAVRYGFTDLVKLLITEGKADVNQRRKLGLVAPIVLASALGYKDIVTILLDNGASVNTVITGGLTPLHLAAAQGEDEVIEILLDHEVSVDYPDDNGNTALMMAVKHSHEDTISLLMCNHSDVDCKNKMGQTVWDIALDNPDDTILKILVRFYKSKRRMSRMMPEGRTPLHVAALRGDANKIKCLIDLGVNPACVDQSGNTFFHIAARADNFELIEKFLDSVDVNQQNSEGDTPIHLAIRHGNEESVKLLLKKTKVGVRNKAGQTPLHEAARCLSISPELIQSLVDTIVKTSSWEMVDATDNHGNTALHFACRKGRPDILLALSSMNPMKANKDGETPLHVMAKAGMSHMLEEYLEVFNQPGKGLNLDKPNQEEETALHIFAKQGDMEQVALLIAVGSDLSVQNTQGNTVLHELAEHNTLQPDNKDAQLAVYNTILGAAPRWWCIKKSLYVPDEESEMFYHYQRLAMVHLTSDIYNKEGLDVVTYAGSIGAIDIIRAIMNTPHVYKFPSAKGYLYDVTNLAPETMTASQKELRMLGKISAVVDVYRTMDYVASTKSFLDIIVRQKDAVTATKILDISPISDLVKNYWNAYQWIYGLLMVIHVVYMACYTKYSIDVLSTYYHKSANSVTNTKPNVWPMSLFLIWPILLLAFEIYYMLTHLVRGCKDMFKVGIRHTLCRGGFSPSTLPYTLTTILFSLLSHFVAFFFVAFVITWFVLYALAHFYQVYAVSAVLIIGWMFTIAFTKGFETVHAFSIMLKYIIIKDMSRFLVIYTCVVLSFSFSFHALLQVSPTLAMNGWNTFFVTFQLMLGLGDVLSDNFADDYAAAGGNVAYVQIVYLGYIVFATIILLNLLIAMMSDTYADVKSKEGTTWRVGSVKLALGIEGSLPFLKKLFKLIGIVDNNLSYNMETERWMLTVPYNKAQGKKQTPGNEVLCHLERLEQKVNQMSLELSKQIDNLHMKVDRFESTGGRAVSQWKRSSVITRPMSVKGFQRSRLRSFSDVRR